MAVRRSQSIGGVGIAYIAISILLGIGAVNSQNNLLFWAFGIAIALVLVSGFVSGSALLRITVKRQTPRSAQVGRPLFIRYVITNRARLLPAFALWIRELPAPRDPASWSGRMPQPVAFCPHVGPRRSIHAEASVTPQRRGHAELGALRVSSSFPLGLSEKRLTFTFDRPARLLVRPRVVPIRSTAIRIAAATSHDSDSPGAVVGRGDEFFGLRDYRPGDSLRRIAWRASARAGDLVVREDLMPSPSRLMVAIHLDRAARSDDLDETAISLAASVVEKASRIGVDAGIVVPGASIDIPPSRGERHVARILDALALIDLDDPALVLPPMISVGRRLRCGWLVIHSGRVDRTIGPSFARRVEAARPASLVESAQELRAASAGAAA